MSAWFFPPFMVPLALLGATVRPAVAGPAGGAAPKVDVCEPISRELAQSRREAGKLRQDLQEMAGRVQSGEREREQCASSADELEEKLSQAQAAEENCRSSSRHQCADIAAFVDELLRGRTASTSELECLVPDQRRRLSALIASWAGTSAALTQLSAFAVGAADEIPAGSARDMPLDRLVRRLTGAPSASLLTYRRLLVEAMHLLAPQAWQHLRSGGQQALESWFTSSSPLTVEILDEVRRIAPATGANGGPLSVALRLVRSYQTVAHCSAASAEPHDACGRARQLQDLLETTGPLVVERRIQDIWASDCSDMKEELVSWIADYASPNVGPKAPEYVEVAEAAYGKLYTCYLDDASSEGTIRGWIEKRLPGARTLTSAQLARLGEIVGRIPNGGPEQVCANAVHALKTMPIPSRCTAPGEPHLEALRQWTQIASSLPDRVATTLDICRASARLLWEGKRVVAGSGLSQPPTPGDLVVLQQDAPETPTARLRRLCEQRSGAADRFDPALRTLASLGRGFGDVVEAPPWRVDPTTLLPVERARFKEATRASFWARHLFQRRSSGCNALGLTEERCRMCLELPEQAAYDCALATAIEGNWSDRSRSAGIGLTLLGFGILVASWTKKFVRARKSLLPWARETRRFLEGIGLLTHLDRLRYLLPERHELLTVELPRESGWDRWGDKACIVRAPSGPRLLERSVNRAAELARRTGSTVSMLVHDDAASPDLGAIRAVLEWAAKGGARSVQVLPLPSSRLRWAKSAADLLDLVDETSLRGNPFEVRGRVMSSTQFFNRERLVSGLLAAAQGGHWQVITGLRRFGKSSLALEVARRLPGPAAYVDLSGFQHEIAHADEPARTADAILRYACIRLAESARHRFRNAQLPEPPAESTVLDLTALTAWFRDLSRACRLASQGGPPPILIILDELEQALAVGPERLRAALDVLAIAIGRLKGSLGEAALPEGGAPVGVFLCSALHPLLWAPLAPLAHQSIMGSFPCVCVPCLPPEAAAMMLRSLGSRQGIRFSDQALARIVEESQGVALLARRICASVLELYDPERARQGGLGAVNVGIEGATEAIDREVADGSPLRVWVDSEICDPSSPTGAILRALAQQDSLELADLRNVASDRIKSEFARTGIDRALSADELRRRTSEASGVMLTLLGETGLLRPIGDLTAPHAYALPKGVIRRALSLHEPELPPESRNPSA